VISGLFKNYFTFINDVEFEMIEYVKVILDKNQLNNLEIIKRLILKTDLVNKEMLYYTWSLSEGRNHNKFMFDI
ncbi:hypothetical protein DAT36_14065, partial [Photobacterium phosphoreum]